MSPESSLECKKAFTLYHLGLPIESAEELPADFAAASP